MKQPAAIRQVRWVRMVNATLATVLLFGSQANAQAQGPPAAPASDAGRIKVNVNLVVLHWRRAARRALEARRGGIRNARRLDGVRDRQLAALRRRTDPGRLRRSDPTGSGYSTARARRVSR